MQPLQGRVAVVAGATRGAGRGIACMLDGLLHGAQHP
jgi:NAD(P)-dependent dehydrogenase (short-subunit alcohol dehydrogenase family)